MSMILRVNQVPYDNFLSGSVEIRLDVLCNIFTFVIARSEKNPLPFRVGDPCEVLVNSVLVFTGTIELMTVSYSENSHTIELAGRDTTSDILDSTLDSLSDFEEGPSLKSIIEIVIEQIGSSLKVVEDFTPDRFNAANDVASPEPGDNAFEFLEKLARQRQVLLTSNGEGNIVISQGSGESLNTIKVQNVIEDNPDNNILNATVSYDNTGRYNLYKLTSQGNPSALGSSGLTDLDSVVDRSGGVSDSAIRKGRQLILSAESSFSDNDDFNRAQWEANIRRARGRLYTAEFRGFSVDGVKDSVDIWEINKLVPVVDDFAGISGNMLINTVVFALDTSGGERSKVTFVEPNAYTLILEEPAAPSTGEGFL